MAEIEMSNFALHRIANSQGEYTECVVNGVSRAGWVYCKYFHYQIGTMFFRVRYE